ncbi:hypothetical protein JCM9279_007051 [Rhodotorula babjevae]
MPSNKQQHSPEALRAVPHNPPSPLLASATAIPALMTSVGPKDKPPSPTSRRKPVPSVSADDVVDEPSPSPTSTTATATARPAFQPPPKLVTSASSVDVRPSTRRQVAPPLRSSTSDDPISPTNRGEFSRGRAAPPTTPPRGSAQRQRSSSRGPPVPVPQDEDDIATLNFDRRPSQIDPLTPSFHYAHSSASAPPVPSLPSGGAPTPRALTGMTFAPLPPPSPVRSPPTEQRGHMRQRSSHARNPSISLSSPLASPTSASYGPHALPPPSSTSASATSADARSSAKILPLQPARTRAPMEAFASVEMLQGQREHQDRTRGTEVFGPGGTYEGRASSLSGEGGLPAYSRRHDPLAAVHAARNPGLAASQHSQQQYGASQLPPLEFDIMSIASQLREHDARRGSEDVRGGEWPRRFSEASSGGDDSPPATPSGGPTLNPAFSFPTRSTSSLKSAAPTYSSNSELGRAFSFAKRDSAGAGDGPGGWRTEHLGASDKAFALQRPSIVALPVYPAPGGTLGRSFKTRAKKWATKVALVTVLLACASSWVYLWVRLGAMRIVERRRPGVFVGGWCYLALETVVTLLMTVHSIWTVFTYRPRSTDPKLRLRGDHNLPSVDVFVVSSGQADQTVFDCAVAAASMDYPPHRYRVMVLDPLASDNLERELTRHAKSQAAPHLSYHRRELGAAPSSVVVDSSDEKTPKLMQEGQRRSSGARGIETAATTAANSINFGMVEAASFGIKGPAEFIAVFDADMIPERNYLRAVLPHILGENKVGLVKTRRGFINLPHRVNQPTATLLTACETPADTRSGFLLRRAALTEIGGFPAASWIHDGQCEALLQGRGYQVQQVDEVLQWGMAKPTYASQIGAMMVNRLGPLRTAHRLGWFIRGDKTRLMPFGARLKAIGKALLPLFSVVVLLLAYVYPFMFTFGGILVLTPNLSNLNRLLQVTLIMILLHKLHEAVWCWSTGLPSPRRVLQAWIFAAPYQGVALARLILPRRLGGYKARTSDLDINEVVAHPVREKWYKRLGWAAIDPLVSTMFAFLAAFGVAIWRIVRDYEHGTTDRHQALLTVLLTIAWPTLLWSEFLFASFVPFVCLLFPSHLLTEPRESFLIRDHYSHVARPKHHFKTASPFKVSRAPEFVTGVVVVAWAVVCVCVAKLTDVLA